MAYERIQPGTTEWKVHYANHLHRYMFAAAKLRELRKRRILDAACGVGYGARYLAAQAGATVLAVDYDEMALAIGSSQFSHPCVTFRRDDCHTLRECEGHAPFDAVVSFETVEHLYRPLDFLVRSRELLAADGLLIVSTPNGMFPSEWQYHQREYRPSEFVALLASAGFSRIELFGQQMTAVGRWRTELRIALHELYTSPFMRIGRRLQRLLRGRKIEPPVIPELVEDYEIVALRSAEQCAALGCEGPFTLICLAWP